MKFSLYTLGILFFAIFLVLQLCGVICWSWLWITAPLWIPALLTLIIITIEAIILTIKYRK